MTDDKGDLNADYTNPDGSVRATRYRYETCAICAGIVGHCEHTRAPSPQEKELMKTDDERTEIQQAVAPA